jgi:tetratricopeptide (TPR) repeat protein
MRRMKSSRQPDRASKGAASQPPRRNLRDVAQMFREAALLHDRGHLQEAEQRYRIVLEADGRHFDALYRLGLIRLQQARFADAELLFRRAAKVDPRSADAQLHLAVALTGLKWHEEAIRRYEKVLALKPNFAEAHNNLGYALQSAGRAEQASVHYRKALAINPDYAEARNNLGTALAALGRHEEAIAQYQAAIALRPAYAEAHRSLANALGVLERYEEAAAHYEKVLSILPNDAAARTALGNTLHRLDGIDEAIAQYEKALAASPAHAEAHTSLGNTVHRLGRTQEAIGHFHRALAIDATDPGIHSSLGGALVALGRTSEASEAFEKAIASAPRKAGFFWNLASVRRFSADDRYLAAMLELGEKISALSTDEQIDLHFALGKAFADIGDHDRSFAHLLQGNALKRQQITYDEEKALQRLARIRGVFAAEMLRDKSGLGCPSAAPIFVVGMPRSGTTLIEQILSSHPQVFGAGELREMANLAQRIGGSADATAFPEAAQGLSGDDLRGIGEQYVQAVRRLAPDVERIVDKMPGNFSLAGLIHLVLPNARIIHARRDARDTAFSCFSLLFSGTLEFTYDLAELGRYYRAYLELMKHWRETLPRGVMLEVQYEDVVGDLEREARRIIAHCGLEWDEACLSFYKTERSVRTASATQVRQPIYQTSIGRWRRHEAQLQPLLRELPP